jgi:hypothetical protein
MLLQKKALEIEGKALEEEVARNRLLQPSEGDEEPLPELLLRERSQKYQDAVENYNRNVPELQPTMEIANERIKTFAGLLPLEELSRYEDSSINTGRDNAVLESDRRTVTISVLADAMNLIESGEVEKGTELLDAVGQIKIAFLGFLLINGSDQSLRFGESLSSFLNQRKVDVLQRDIEEYYQFVQRYVNANGSVAGACRPGLKLRLADCQMRDGVFRRDLGSDMSRFWSSLNARAARMMFPFWPR